MFTFVLGMHRSGTTCLAECLHALGMSLGPYPMITEYFEPVPVNTLNEEILAANQGSWHTPPNSIVCSNEHRLKMDEYLAVFDAEDSCIKDPRLLLIYDWILAAQKYNFKLIGTFRHPTAVAKSHAARDHLPKEQIYGLWTIYNQKMLELYDQYQFPIIEYDMTAATLYRKTVCLAAKQLGLNSKAIQLNNIAVQKEDHNNSKLEAVPEECRIIMQKLKKIAFRI